MYNTSARVALVNERLRRLRRKRQRDMIGALFTVCLTLSGFLVGTMAALTGGMSPAELSMHGSMLLYRDAGGYVLVGVVSFTVAMVVTALCIKYRNKEKKQNKEEKNRK